MEKGRGIAYLKEYLPEGWEKACRTEGALQRERQIKTAEDLLKLNLLYLTQGESYQMTSVLMELTEEIHLNKTAVRKRIQGSWLWLKWLAEKTAQKGQYLGEKPEWLGEKNVCLIDGSDIALKGSTTSDYRLHCMVNLFGLELRHLEMTDIKEGEKLCRYETNPEDIVIADRAYGSIAGMEHLKAQKSGFILRLRSKCFNLYDEQGRKINLAEQFSHLEDWQSEHLTAYYRLKTPQGDIRCPVRISALKKDAKTQGESVKRQAKTFKRKNKSHPSDVAVLWSQYIIVATSLDESVTDKQIFDLYRSRWQIELVFKRLKGLFKFGEIPSHNEDSIKAWFYGKLFLAILCQVMEQSGPFPPTEKMPFFFTEKEEYLE